MSIIKRIAKTFDGDQVIWIIVVLLTLVSAMAVYSSTSMLAFRNHTDASSYLFKHLSLIVIAFLSMWAIHNVSYQYYTGLYKILLPLSYGALIYASIFGAKVNDAGRWIKIPIINLTFQASDLAKLALVLFLARHISANQHQIKDFRKGFLPMLLVTLSITFLVFLENISTSIMILCTSFIVMFLGQVDNKQFFGTILAGLATVALGLFLLFNVPDRFLVKRLSTGKSRIASFLDTKKDFKDVSYQVKQSNIAIARGGLLPHGPGNSSQKNFLPNAFSDYVFAIIIEEWGLFGGLFVMSLYLILLFRVILLVVKSPKSFGAMIAIGLALSIVIQAYFNIGVTVGLLPATGVTLPLVSMGGSSIIFIAIAIGIILSVSRSVQDEELGAAPSKENYMDEVQMHLNTTE